MKSVISYEVGRNGRDEENLQDKINLAEIHDYHLICLNRSFAFDVRVTRHSSRVPRSETRSV